MAHQNHCLLLVWWGSEGVGRGCESEQVVAPGPVPGSGLGERLAWWG